eukprot:4109961-Pyramimonas_sp.AAC.1
MPSGIMLASVSPHLRSSASYWLNPSGCTSVSNLCASWATAAETSILFHHGPQVTPGPSRAAGPSVSVQALRQTLRMRELPLRDQRSQWWTRIHAVFKGLQGHRQRGNGDKQSQ